MLTLTRKIGESIRIGDDITVVIKEIKGKHVRVGIMAPQETFVYREELYLKIQESNAQAAASSASTAQAGIDRAAELLKNFKRSS